MKKRTESIMGMAFFGPALVLLTIFLFLPMILTLIFSFTDFFALNPGLTHFVGLDNYIQIFKDDVFSQAFFNTVKFVIILCSGGHVTCCCVNTVDPDLQPGRNYECNPFFLWN